MQSPKKIGPSREFNASKPVIAVRQPKILRLKSFDADEWRSATLSRSRSTLASLEEPRARERTSYGRRQSPRRSSGSRSDTGGPGEVPLLTPLIGEYSAEATRE